MKAYITIMNYNYNKHIDFDAANKTITQMLQSFFYPKSALINTPLFLISQGGKQVTVQLSYYLAPKARVISSNTLKSLTNALTRVYEAVAGQPTSVQLELVRQHRPYMDATILAQHLAINASKHGFNRIMDLLLNTVPYLDPDYAFGLGPNGSSITGVKVQLSGLLTSQRNRSRKSVYTASAGTFHTPKNNADMTSIDGSTNQILVDYGSYTSKSGLGAFTVKV